MQGKNKLILLILAAALLLAGIYASRLFKEKKLFQRSEYIMGTIFDITAAGSNENALEDASRKAFIEIKRIDDLMSRYKEGSEVSLVNRNAGIAPVKVSHELIEVLRDAVEISEFSEGSFDVTIGPLTSLWNFDEEKKTVPLPEEIERRRRLVDYRKLKIDEAASTVFLEEKGMMIDVGGIAKGYSLSRSMKIFEESGIRNVIINAGGNLNISGGKKGRPWRIGIQDPRDEKQLLGKIQITDICIATSGDYQRFFIKDGVRYHHIIDPKTGYPAKGLISATVIGKGRTSMDGFSSAVFILGAEKGAAFLKKIGAEGILVAADGKIIISEGIKNRFSLKP